MIMKTEDIRIRPVTPADARQLLDIYAPYVEKTAISFEYDVPSPEAFEKRIRKTLQRYPYIAAERNGELLGYAYTSPFVGRAAYDWAVETSIYLREDCRKMGIGKMLYAKIEEISRAQNILSLNACIGCPENDAADAHLDRNSMQFHAHLGFRLVGEFYKCGYKFGTWYNMVWMEKIIGEHPAVPAPVIAFPDLDIKSLF
ncbi:acetyltransferase, GNAT family [Marvinbryantia formatexigens DSM 14469]|uniref:Acetyltransferase, GNAT family n=1 Tax=Marvinbryantia formatexigens DSM 14469 TaxID=478749 RepID=C6LEY9_9FIRM|nr:GNAT family N-acetyltransferase [Marvinbryantia formatexigens]EET60728.1 acetyltransferase, GNAT family [Marvinbryantia formatexigens DSM 14469]SDG34184.1 phosphinothricin acetyltransferase [Marvinbryantia formatexigens]